MRRKPPSIVTPNPSLPARALTAKGFRRPEIHQLCLAEESGSSSGIRRRRYLGEQRIYKAPHTSGSILLGLGSRTTSEAVPPGAVDASHLADTGGLEVEVQAREEPAAVPLRAEAGRVCHRSPMKGKGRSPAVLMPGVATYLQAVIHAGTVAVALGVPL